MLFLPQLKRCSGCKEIKALEEFNRLQRASDGRQYYCRACNAKWHADNRAQHNKIIKARNKRIGQELTRRLFDYKRALGCADCGTRDPLVLEFDHLRDKAALVSVLARNTQNWRRIMDEVAKCDVVCANCHRRRTAQRANDIRWRLWLDYQKRIRRLEEVVGRPRLELGTTTA